MKFLRLIRFPNLLMIALTQYLVMYTIITPILSDYHTGSSLSSVNFLILVLSTVCIAAGGYVINDFNDLSIDTINKPEKIKYNVEWYNKWCFSAYALFTIAGIAGGCYLTFFQDIKLALTIHILSAGLLWFYTPYLKKIPLLANLVISFLTAMSLLIILLCDINSFNELSVRKIIFAYSVFAFVLTLIREIIKDMEDKNGDAAYGRKTLPILIGNKVSKLVVSFLIFLVLFSLLFIQYSEKQWEELISFLYVVICIELPLVVLLFLILRADSQKEFHRCSSLSKVIMLSGILSMLVFYLRFK